MNLTEIILAAASAFRTYQKLGDLAQSHGMDPQEFAASVNAELDRLDRWVEQTDAAEDSVFRVPPSRDE